MKVLLLGGSGLLGHHVMQQLQAQGHQVVALVRRRGSIQLSEAHHEERVGSLLDYGDLSAASEGCDAIVNCAGVTDMSLLHYEQYLPVNCDLCFLLIRLMHERGIRRLVHVGTANTIGYGTADHPADEQQPMQQPFSSSYYARSKWAGQQALIHEAQRHPDWHIAIVCPGFLIGAYDVKPSSGKLMLAAYRRWLMAAPRGGKSFVAASDVAVAVVNSLTMGRSGQPYLLTGENLTLCEFYRLQATVCGYRQHLITLPTPLVRLAGYVGDLLRFFRIRTQLSSCNVRQLLVREYYDNRRAIADLAMPQTAIGQAIQEFFEWYNHHTT